MCSAAQLCLSLWDPMDCSPPGSSIHGISQARILEQVAVSFSRGSSYPRDQAHISRISCSGKRILYHWYTWEALWSWLGQVYSWLRLHAFIAKIQEGLSSVHSVMSDSLRPHEPQHARLPCPSSTPRVHPNPCPLSWWCHPTITSSVIPLSSCPQYFPASGSFQMSQLFTSGGQSIGVSASTSVLPMKTQDWFPLGWTGWISLQSKGLSKSLLQHHSSKASILWPSAFFTVQLSHQYMTTGKTIALTRRTFVGKVMSLLLNMLSRLVITFLPRSKCLLISWLQSPSAKILEPPKMKSDTVFTVSPCISHEVMGPDVMI